VLGSQAGAETLQSWRDQLEALIVAKLAAIETRPTLTVLSGQAATIRVASQGASSERTLEVAVTPEVAHSDSVRLDLRINSTTAEGALQLWAEEAGLALGPSASLERDVVVLPGGGVGLAAAVRTPLGRDGWLVVIVVPSVLPPAPSNSLCADRAAVGLLPCST